MKAAEKACNGLPDKFAPTCRAFVDTYTAAVVALLAQDIDPSQVSPWLICKGIFTLKRKESTTKKAPLST